MWGSYSIVGIAYTDLDWAILLRIRALLLLCLHCFEALLS